MVSANISLAFFIGLNPFFQRYPYILDERFESAETASGEFSSLHPGRLLMKRSNCLVPDSRVSKQHFRIYSIIYEEGRIDLPPLVYCEDLESSNGTYVNDVLIGIICRERRGFLLNDGDIIEIRPSWKFQFHQLIHDTVSRDSTELSDLEVLQLSFLCKTLLIFH
jgi:pSer/pThr/pTyr-binding forkhead associated (FHA) protein